MNQYLCIFDLNLNQKYARTDYIPKQFIVFAFQNNPETGTIRETFFMNQLYNSGHSVHISPEKADFIVDDHYVFEIGGKNKDRSKIKGIDNGYMALDDLEHGFDRTIPLWLFGFLY